MYHRHFKTELREIVSWELWRMDCGYCEMEIVEIWNCGIGILKMGNCESGIWNFGNQDLCKFGIAEYGIVEI